MEDPMKWTTDEIVKQLCHFIILYTTAECPVPDQSTCLSLESVIRQQGTTGANLLEDANTEISQVMGRQSYVCIVRLLRSKSTSYQHKIAIKGVQSCQIEDTTAAGEGRKRRRVEPQSIQLSTAPSYARNEREQTWFHLMHWENGNTYSDPEESMDDDEEADEDQDEDDSEEEADEDDDDITEEDAVNPEIPRKGKLSSEEIIRIMNDCIDKYTEDWEPGKDQEEDYITDAAILLENAIRSGQQKLLVTKNQAKIDWLRSRLDATGDRIFAEAWSREEALRRQCRALEETVNQLQEAEWLLAIYQSGAVENRPTSSASVPDIIDLGSGSDSSDDREDIVSVHSPEPKSARPTIEEFVESDLQPTPTRPITVISDNPGQASIRSISEWDWESLIEKKDRKRIVMKVINEMSVEKREMIRTRINNVRKHDLVAEIPACINMFRQSGGTNMKMRGVLPRDLPKIMAFTRLFLCWWLAGNYFDTDAKEWRMEDLAEALDGGSQDRNIFYDWVRHVFNNTFSLESCSKPFAPSQAEIIVISDDED
ncbi:hypothetical protein DM02DRAFT_285430 [Periconia macrospinosa]|uniref:DUF7607 domain-containing protein n=1 Tax=Periconia macrospinosa TaxID=97972 RepID=A0A2V1EAR0_9PLEO|nr:hypothetical protein DM02DRAFT_285430 [Periconia macrospinosa]